MVYSPDWLKIELEDNFSRLDSVYQDLYANVILNAEDPYVDEIAFCVAHLAPQTLINSQFYPGTVPIHQGCPSQFIYTTGIPVPVLNMVGLPVEQHEQS